MNEPSLPSLSGLILEIPLAFRQRLAMSGPPQLVVVVVRSVIEAHVSQVARLGETEIARLVKIKILFAEPCSPLPLEPLCG